MVSLYHIQPASDKRTEAAAAPAGASRRKWLALLALVVVLFFWKILFTREFSVFVDHDNANGAFAWNNFAVTTLKQGVLPLWNPYSQSGQSFVGEMQTALFYPLKLLLHAWPLNRAGMVSLQLLHELFVLAHLLAAWFMFRLAEELGLERFSAFIAAICFSLGGFVGRVGWPNMLDSAAWLPLIVLLEIRALRTPSAGRAAWQAALAGLSLGMAILAGSIHVALMDVVVVVSAAVYFYFAERGALSPSAARLRAAMIVGVIGTVAFCAAAVQLLPSIEYSGHALRNRYSTLAALPATQRVPYGELMETFAPQSILAFLFGGMSAGALAFSTYFGIFPLLLAVIGVWKNWDKSWVRYLAGLAVAAFLFTLGRFSALHGLAYTLVPYLWMAWQAGRFIYLTHFAMALLAGFGAGALFAAVDSRESLAGLARVLKWAVIAGALALAVPAMAAKPQTDQWIFFSFLLLVSTYGLFLYIQRRPGRAAKFLVVALIFFDLSAFNWTLWNKIEEQKAGRNYLEKALTARGVAAFLKAQPGVFRVHVEGDWSPHIGALYGVQTTGGLTATVLKDYVWFWEMPRATDMLNVRYFVTEKTVEGNTPAYQDAAWKVYENHKYLPRAWVVHDAAIELSGEALERRLRAPGFDPLRAAIINEPLTAPLDAGNGGEARVVFDSYRADGMEIRARSRGRGLLVLSESHYPGWRATVNGSPQPIYKVNGLLRGVEVPAGESKVVLSYAPRSVLAGALLSALTFAAALAFAAGGRIRARKGRGPEAGVSEAAAGRA